MQRSCRSRWLISVLGRPKKEFSMSVDHSHLAKSSLFCGGSSCLQISGLLKKFRWPVKLPSNQSLTIKLAIVPPNRATVEAQSVPDVFGMFCATNTHAVGEEALT